MQARRPQQISPYAEACLQALADSGLGERISLGGAFGLLHYLDYRPTHDIDAWWAMPLTTGEQEQVLGIVESALAPFGEVSRRLWGDVVSIELRQEGKTVFGFQIARRSAQLAPATASPWAGVRLDSFADLIAAKMVALVERGAPRDFRDIYTLCQSNLVTPAQCWQWWRERQRLAGSDDRSSRARLAVETHLARIARHRPLEQIEDPSRREAAERLRTWFQTEFLDALVD